MLSANLLKIKNSETKLCTAVCNVDLLDCAHMYTGSLKLTTSLLNRVVSMMLRAVFQLL